MLRRTLLGVLTLIGFAPKAQAELQSEDMFSPATWDEGFLKLPKETPKPNIAKRWVKHEDGVIHVDVFWNYEDWPGIVNYVQGRKGFYTEESLIAEAEARAGQTLGDLLVFRDAFNETPIQGLWKRGGDLLHWHREPNGVWMSYLDMRGQKPCTREEWIRSLQG